jgi:hypothetical protein
VLDASNPWYAARQPNASSAPSDEEQRAAELTEEHADTPAITHFDVLGRPFLVIADNGNAGEYATRTALDIEGNPLSVTDARENVAMEYTFDMLGRTLYQKSVDAGERWSLHDVMGQPIRGWDSRGTSCERCMTICVRLPGSLQWLAAIASPTNARG